MGAERGPPHPAVRAADADRERAAVLLRDHAAEGRLSIDELSERLDAVYSATTVDELERVLVDLPARQPSPRQPTRWTVGFMGGAAKRGSWRIAGRTRAIAFMGGCELDLRAAELDGDVVTVTAISFMGGVDIVVPEGVEVDVGGFVLMGGRDVDVRRLPLRAGAPLVRVRAWGLMGGVRVRHEFGG